MNEGKIWIPQTSGISTMLATAREVCASRHHFEPNKSLLDTNRAAMTIWYRGA